MTWWEKCKVLDETLKMLGASEYDAHVLACKIATAIDTEGVQEIHHNLNKWMLRMAEGRNGCVGDSLYTRIIQTI